MTRTCVVFRTCGLLVFYLVCVYASEKTPSEPWIVSIEKVQKTCVDNRCKYLLDVSGGEYLGHSSWRLTPNEAVRGSSCDVIYSNYELREIKTSEWLTKLQITLPENHQKIFFCLHHEKEKNTPFGGRWVHQGQDLFINSKDTGNLLQKIIKTDPEKEKYTQETIPLKGSLQESMTFGDLSHDTDVNYLPRVPRPTRNERKDIEVLINNKYTPLNSENDNNVKNIENSINKDITDVTIGRKYKGNYQIIQEQLNSVLNDIDSELHKDLINLLTKHSNRQKRDTVQNKDNVLPNKTKANHKEIDNSNVNTLNNDEAVQSNVNAEVFEFFNKYDEINRLKRDVIKANATDWSEALITPEDIRQAKKELLNDVNSVKKVENHTDALIKMRKHRQAIDDFTSVRDAPVKIGIVGIRVESSDKTPDIVEQGIPSVMAETRVTLRLFGQGLTARSVIAFTHDALDYGQPCKFMLKGEFLALEESITPHSALFEIVAPPLTTESKLYICAKNLPPDVNDPSKDEAKHIHQGKETFKMLATHNPLLPLWASMILILSCLTFSALFSGLNLGLMSLDRTELKIISNTGTDQERKYARAIMPVRDHGNYLLCSILLGNVAVNSTFTILLDELTSGLFAVIFSTLSIVLLGEITPQAICSRHGLMVGAKSIMITKAVMALTAPLAYPVSKLLDYFLGEEIGSVYNRERLKELVKITTDLNDLDRDEVNIISGALELRKKTVSEVMTKLDDVFMLPITSVLDFETMSEIIKSGYSRIPVYEGHRGNIVTVLFIKDLAFVDPDDNTPLRTLCQYYQNPCNFVFEDVTLDVMFKQFKDGHKGHMAFVHRINNEGEGDPFYETMGLVTLEDVIEEMIQAEIVDETDVFMDNRTKRRRNKPTNKLQDFTAFAERHENQRIHISPQLTLATFQFLSSSVDAFRPDTVSETVLRRMLKQDVIQYIKLKGKTKKDATTYVYHQGKPVDYFVLILEGRVEVTVGRENLVFEAGPFTYFGVQALTQNVGVAESPCGSAMGSLQNINMEAMLRHTFVPDYSVRATVDLYYLTVKRSLYLAAKRATLMEKGALSKGATHEQFDTEVDKHLVNSPTAAIPVSFISKKLLVKSNSTVAADSDGFGSCSHEHKLLQSVDEDLSMSGDQKTPSRQISPNPVSASPLTRASFASRASPDLKNGDLYSARPEEQEKLLK